MKIAGFFRTNDWWEPKLLPLLTIAYASILFEGGNLLSLFPSLLFLVLIFIFVAVYVSLLNNYTDLREDTLSGKKNRLRNKSPKLRFLLVTGSLAISISLLFFLRNDLLSILFVVLGIISFSLYSLPPFRLKNREVLGVLADACGSHLFPSLFFTSAVYHFMDKNINIPWLILIGIWSFAYGLRGILWHQFQDIDFDLSINLKTFATSKYSSLIKPISICILAIEIVSLGILLWLLHDIYPLIALIFYSLLLYIYKQLKKTIVIINSTREDDWYIFMTDYYQVLFPISLIISASIADHVTVILFLFHFLFFPLRNKKIVKSLLQITRLKKFIAI